MRRTTLLAGSCAAVLVLAGASAIADMTPDRLSLVLTAVLIAWLQKYMIGHGQPTYGERALYFGVLTDKACGYLKRN